MESTFVKDVGTCIGETWDTGIGGTWDRICGRDCFLLQVGMKFVLVKFQMSSKNACFDRLIKLILIQVIAMQ